MKTSKTCPTDGFPMVALMVLLVGVLWLLSDMGVIAVNIPWVPVIVIIAALGMLFKHCK